MTLTTPAGEALRDATDADSLLRAALEASLRVTDAERGLVVLADLGTGRIYAVQSLGLQGEELDRQRPVPLGGPRHPVAESLRDGEFRHVFPISLARNPLARRGRSERRRRRGKRTRNGSDEPSPPWMSRFWWRTRPGICRSPTVRRIVCSWRAPATRRDAGAPSTSTECCCRHGSRPTSGRQRRRARVSSPWWIRKTAASCCSSSSPRPPTTPSRGRPAPW